MDRHLATKEQDTGTSDISLFEDVQKQQHVTIDYCSTDEIIGDVFTKPVGGTKFCHFCNIIMNISHDEY